MSNGFMGTDYLRRLPVYLLLDCSSSMQGDAIIALNEGLTMIHRELVNDPQALETVYISVISFATHADQFALVPLDQFVPPILQADGTTSMGQAFDLLVESIEQDLTLNTPTQHGDYRPLVFLLTDGAPTDEYRNALNRLKALRGSKKPTIIALGCGSNVNLAILHEVTNSVFLMQTVTIENIKGFFKWITGSVMVASRAVGGGPGTTNLDSPATLPGITYSPY